MNILLIIKWLLNGVMLMLWDWVCVKEPDALREEAPLNLSVFAIMLRKGSKMKRRLPSMWFESLMILAALFLQRLR